MAPDFKTQCQIAHVLLNELAEGRSITPEQKNDLIHFLYVAREKAERPHTDEPINLSGLIELFDTAYGWTIDVYGEIHGLVAGDMGFEGSGVFLKDLVEDALTVSWQKREFDYEQKLGEFIAESVRVIQSEQTKGTVEQPVSD